MHQVPKAGWISTLLSSMLILLFVYTASSKLMDRYRFEVVLSKMPYIGAAAPVLSWAVPLVEIGIAVLLLLPPARQKGFAFSGLLLLLFTVYLGLVLWLAPQLPCSCGGVVSVLGWREHFLFNSFFILIAFTGWWIEKGTVHLPYNLKNNTTFYSNKPPAGGRQA